MGCITATADLWREGLRQGCKVKPCYQAVIRLYDWQAVCTGGIILFITQVSPAPGLRYCSWIHMVITLLEVHQIRSVKLLAYLLGPRWATRSLARKLLEHSPAVALPDNFWLPNTLLETSCGPGITLASIRADTLGVMHWHSRCDKLARRYSLILFWEELKKSHDSQPSDTPQIELKSIKHSIMLACAEQLHVVWYIVQEKTCTWYSVDQSSV